MISDLHPFQSRLQNDNTIVPYNNSFDQIYASGFNPSNARSIGIRCPIVLVGWGYDLQGRPVPNNFGPNLSGINANVSGHKFYGQVSGLTHGANVQASAYIAAPLDVRFDYRSGNWTAEHKFLAQITSASEANFDASSSYVNGPKYFYSFTEVLIKPSHLPNKIPANGGTSGITPIYPAKGGSNYTAAVNLADFGLVIAEQVPINTYVWMTTYRNHNRTIYVFNYTGTNNVFIEGFVTNPVEINFDPDNYKNRYWYEARLTEVKWVDSVGKFAPKKTLTDELEDLFAYNIHEVNNTNTVVRGIPLSQQGPIFGCIDMVMHPADFLMPVVWYPIGTGSGTGFPNPSGETIWGFEYMNDFEPEDCGQFFPCG